MADTSCWAQREKLLSIKHYLEPIYILTQIHVDSANDVKPFYMRGMDTLQMDLRKGAAPWEAEV